MHAAAQMSCTLFEPRIYTFVKVPMRMKMIFGSLDKEGRSRNRVMGLLAHLTLEACNGLVAFGYEFFQGRPALEVLLC